MNSSAKDRPNSRKDVEDIPVTLNGKKVEIAARNVLEGKPVTNKDALANPEALDYFTNLPELKN